jgi:acetylornithine deacetylase
MLERLVAFPTVSRDGNLELIDYVRSYLQGFGIASELTFDDERRKANLFATIGPEDRGGICLSGHTDVVPVDGQDWSVPPFAVTEREGRLHGRGACDMKGFLAAVLGLVPEFLERNLRIPIHLALSYDEEVGCLGVRRLLARLAEREVKPAACIVGEPTGMTPVTGHKGKLSMRCHVHGLECHSAIAPTGVNAVEYAAELIVRLRRMAAARRTGGPFDLAYDPPYTTIHTGVVQGGTALNIVPRDCRFDFEFRYLPADDPGRLLAEVTDFAARELLPQMRAVSPDAGFRFEEIAAFPGLAMTDDDPVTRQVMELTGAERTGRVSFGTEAGLFQAAGIPTIVCGPGQIAQAHKPDEFIEIDQLARCEGFLRRLADRIAG